MFGDAVGWLVGVQTTFESSKYIVSNIPARSVDYGTLMVPRFPQICHACTRCCAIGKCFSGANVSPSVGA